MKWTILTAIVGLMFLHTPHALDIKIGDHLPKAGAPLKDISNKDITLNSALQSNGLLVMFSCNTCPVVIRNQSRTKEVCSYAKAHHIGVVLLNANEADRSSGNSLADMQAYAKEQGYDWYYAIDKGDLAEAFGASRTPESFLFDKTGKLVYHGAIDDSPGDPATVKRHHLQSAIDELLAGKDISVKETRSVGCSIHRN